MSEPSLVWTPDTRTAGASVLYDGNTALATLVVERASGWRRLLGRGYQLTGRAAVGQRRWTFHHTHLLGLFLQGVQITAEGSAADHASFKIGRNGTGTLCLSDGYTLSFGPSEPLGHDRMWWDEAGTQLLALDTSPDQPETAVVVLDAGELRRDPLLGLLATLGWYLHILHQAQQRNAAADVFWTASRA